MIPLQMYRGPRTAFAKISLSSFTLAICIMRMLATEVVAPGGLVHGQDDETARRLRDPWSRSAIRTELTRLSRGASQITPHGGSSCGEDRHTAASCHFIIDGQMWELRILSKHLKSTCCMYVCIRSHARMKLHAIIYTRVSQMKTVNFFLNLIY
jgi:hypothetical protein